jgi:tetratricopeptide (TPR) repeat protein
LDGQIELACRVAGRNLNIQEWQQYMGNLPYEITCPKLGIHHSVLEAARDAARRGEINTAVAQFNRILEIEPDPALKPEEEAKKIYATSVLEEGRTLADKGKIKKAITNYKKAQKLDPTMNIDFTSWNVLCWQGALNGLAQAVMNACERAVALAPEDAKAQCRDSRGLARALTADYPGAIEDFKAYVDWSKKDPHYEEYRQKRESWIGALEAGKNPFDKTTLEALSNE